MSLPPRSPSRLLAGAAALLLALALAACGGRRGGPPNVLLISLDTTRRDHLSVYGYERATSPALEKLAAEGARFDLAYSPIATTGPSHSTMFTSLYPIAHHVVKNGMRLSEDLDTLAELLSARGYQTAAVVSSFVLTRKFGYSQGFTHFEDDFTVEGTSMRVREWEGQKIEGGFDRRADDATARAIRWLDEDRDDARPFFLFVHYFDPHSPYTPPPDFADRFQSASAPDFLSATIARYDEEIAFTDHEIGVLLDEIEAQGLKEDTIVVVTGDHGEGLMQHGNPEHGLNIYEEAVRVPLLVRWPGKVPAGEVRSEPVELVDLAPTILNLAGFPGPSSFQGRSLARALRGEADLEAERPVFLHRRHYAPQVIGRTRVAGEKLGVRHGKWKLILGPEEGTRELFDLGADPEELRNVYSAEPAAVASLQDLLERWKALVAREGTGSYELSDEDRSKLEALGYTE